MMLRVIYTFVKSFVWLVKIEFSRYIAAYENQSLNVFNLKFFSRGV